MTSLKIKKYNSSMYIVRGVSYGRQLTSGLLCITYTRRTEKVVVTILNAPSSPLPQQQSAEMKHCHSFNNNNNNKR